MQHNWCNMSTMDQTQHSAPASSSCRSMRLFQLLRALFAANLNRLAADRDLDRVLIQFVVASCTSFFCHDITLQQFPPIAGTRAVGHVAEKAAIRIFSDLIARRQTSPIKLKSMLCRTKATIATKIRRFPPCMLLPLAESPLSLHSCRSTHHAAATRQPYRAQAHSGHPEKNRRRSRASHR